MSGGQDWAAELQTYDASPLAIPDAHLSDSDRSSRALRTIAARLRSEAVRLDALANDLDRLAG